MDPTELLTSAQAAAELGVHVSTVHALNEKGQLPYAMKMHGERGPKLFDARVVAALKARRAAIGVGSSS